MAPIKESTWLITGSNGQLGSALTQQLANQGFTYSSPSRQELNIAEASSIANYFQSHKPNVVINTAAWTNVDLAEKNQEYVFKVNSLGPELLAKECSLSNAKLIQISSDYVFSGHVKAPRSEYSPTSPKSVYGKSKARGEELVLDILQQNAIVIRTAWLFSPWRTNFVKSILHKIQENESQISVVTDQIGQPTSAIDLASRIIALVMKNLPGGIYHGTNSGEASRYDFANEIFELVGANKDRLIKTVSKDYLGSDIRPQYSVLGHDSWLRLGFEPMEHWRIALARDLPIIVENVQDEIEAARGN